MPITRQLGDRALTFTKLAELLEYLNRQLVPMANEMRGMLNRWARTPPLLAIDLGAIAIDWSKSRHYALDLDNPVTAVSFTNPPDAGDYVLLVKQVGGGNDIAGWPSSVLWVGAAVPVITATNGHYDLLRFFYDGTRYIGDARQNAI